MSRCVARGAKLTQFVRAFSDEASKPMALPLTVNDRSGRRARADCVRVLITTRRDYDKARRRHHPPNADHVIHLRVIELHTRGRRRAWTVPYPRHSAFGVPAIVGSRQGNPRAKKRKRLKRFPL